MYKCKIATHRLVRRSGRLSAFADFRGRRTIFLANACSIEAQVNKDENNARLPPGNGSHHPADGRGDTRESPLDCESEINT